MFGCFYFGTLKSLIESNSLQCSDYFVMDNIVYMVATIHGMCCYVCSGQQQ